MHTDIKQSGERWDEPSSCSGLIMAVVVGAITLAVGAAGAGAAVVAIAVGGAGDGDDNDCDKLHHC